MRRPLAILTTLAVTAGGLALSAPLAFAEPLAPASVTKTAARSGQASALTMLADLPVRREGHSGSYLRAKFGGWNDADRDGENTRAEVLKKESRITASVSAGGTVKGGKWVSAYDNTIVTKASRMDVDHMIPLAEAWASGAWRWSAKRREGFGNDLGYAPSLVAVSQSSNRSKGDSDPAEWMPESAAYTCKYARSWVAVKSRWKLTVDAAERNALVDVLSACVTMDITKPGKPNIDALLPKSKPKKRPDGGSPSSGSGSTGGTDPQYGTCTELLRHPNHAPYRRGVDPEYGWYQDRDGDGLVCE